MRSIRRLLTLRIPDHLDGDAEWVRRCRLVHAAARIISLLAVPFLLANYWSVGHIGPSVLALGLGTVLMGLNPWILRRTGSYRLAGTLLLVELTTALTAMIYFNGGPESAALLWIVVVPLLASLLLGGRVGVVFGCIAIAQTAAFFVASGAGYVFPQPLSQQQTLWWQMAGLCSVLGFVSFFSWLFERERRAAETTIRSREAQLSAIISNLDIVFFSIDRAGIFTVSAGKALQALGLEPGNIVGQSVFDVYSDYPEMLEKLRRALDGETVLFETEFEGVFFQTWCAPSSIVGGVVEEITGVALDVTDRKRMEAHMALTDRMASLGTLAAGVAHEINNPLTWVQGNIEHALSEMPARDDKQRRTLDHAADGARRIEEIVRGLQMFSCPTSHEARPADVAIVIKQAVNLARINVDHRANLVVDLVQVPPAALDAGPLGQVLVNLLMNAAQAIPEGDPEGNEIRITVRPQNSDRILITVRDTGSGIPAESIDRIFDPFYTTKQASGTGLGLAISHRLVSEARGTLTVHSEPGVGSCFSICIPVADKVAAPVPESDAPPRRQTQPVDLSVLIIDDEPLVARALKRTLRRYDVTVCNSGRAALELCRQNDYDLIFCDLMMPECTGMDFFEQLQELGGGAEQHIVFITGGVFTDRARTFLDTVENRCVYKPFKRAEILEIARAFRDERVGAAS